MWPELTGEQFFAVLRQWGWTLIIDDGFWWAYRDQGVVARRLPFLQETILAPEDVELWAGRFGLTINEF